jgi:predicted neutral ceramidase superfamily lipid hydrolase
MYDAQDLLTRIDDHKWAVIGVCFFAMIGNYIFFIVAFRESLRLKMFTIPIFCTLFWFAHDLSFVYRFDDWFNDYDHWYAELFWFALVLTVTFECVYLSQVIRYGGKELLPEATQGQWAALVVAGMVGAVIMWEAVKFVFDDPLYAGSFGIANFSYVLMGVALAVRRRSMLGQPPGIWAGFLLLVVCWSTANFLWFPDAFREPQWVMLHIGSFVGGCGLLYASIRWPGKAHEPAAPAVAAERTPQPA